MSKTKSVVLTVILTIVIALLCLVCVMPEFSIPFSIGGIWMKYNSVVSVIDYGSDLGGGYSAIYYPEGVISVEDYTAEKESYEVTLDETIRKYLGIAESETYSVDELRALYEASARESKNVEDAMYALDEFVDTYVAYSGENFPDVEGLGDAVLYLEDQEVCYETSDGKYAISEEFKSDFESAVKIISKRFDKKNFSSLSVCVKDGCTIQVSVPYSVDDPDSLFSELSYSGEFILRAGDDVSTKPLLHETGEHPLSDYFRGASSLTSGSGDDAEGVVKLTLTSLGRDRVYDITDWLRSNETDSTLYFYVGDTQVIGLGLSDLDDGIDQRTLYISGSFTEESAENVAIVIDSCIKNGTVELDFSVSETMTNTVVSGESNLTAVYVIFALLMAGMFIFSIVRYKGLGVAHAYAYLSYLICMLMFMAFLSGMLVSASGVIAVALTSITMVLGNYYVFENVRKEFNTGKTLDSAIKAGYKRSLAPVLDTHILLFIIAFVLLFASVGELVTFCYIFLLGILMSGISILLLTRFYWYIMRGLLARSKQYKFSGFKREVSDDDED